ncbi:MAG: tRNA (adenosine(37)-N6)-threonylcarbamoyltransferase complex dimerization subunit type 1 TsaB [Acidobacteriaceae bacterium]
MRILVVDTCGAVGGVAFAEDGVVREAEIAGRSSAEQLIPAVRTVMDGVAVARLDAIAVVNGPGSFTGVRVGVSAAKGLGEAAAVPLIALSRLAVLAAKAGGDDVIHSVLDAGRGEFYHGLFGRLDKAHEETEGSREELLTRAGLAASLGEWRGRLVVCEEAVAEALDGLNPVLVESPRAADALPLAARAFEAGEFADAAALDGNYLRRAEVEMLARQKSHQTQAAASRP